MRMPCPSCREEIDVDRSEPYGQMCNLCGGVIERADMDAEASDRRLEQLEGREAIRSER